MPEVQTSNVSSKLADAQSMIQAAAAKAMTDQIFKLTYKYRGQIQECMFKAPDMKRAASLAENYCRLYGYKYLHVTAFLSDLEVLIDKKLNAKPEDGNQ